MIFQVCSDYNLRMKLHLISRMLRKNCFATHSFSFVLGFKLSSTVLERPESTSSLHSHTKERERDTTVRVIVDVNSSVKPVRV